MLTRKAKSEKIQDKSDKKISKPLLFCTGVFT